MSKIGSYRHEGKLLKQTSQDIAHENEIKEAVQEVYCNSVEGSRGDWYNVTKFSNGKWTCSCLDHTYRGRDCKHITYEIQTEGESCKCAGGDSDSGEVNVMCDVCWSDGYDLGYAHGKEMASRRYETAQCCGHI